MHDYSKVKRVPGVDDMPSLNTGVMNSIGSGLREKYDDIFPLLALLYYRWNAEAGSFENYLLRVFHFDTLMGRKPGKVLLGKLLAPVLWCFSWLKYRGRESKEKIVFSNTFIKGRRYPLVRREIEERYGCIAVLTLWDTLESMNGDTAAAIRKTLRCDWGRKSPIFIPSGTVAGKKLQRCVAEYSQYVYENGGRDPQEIDRLLSALRVAYQQRRSWLKKRLEKQCIHSYTTVNQYNLRDLLFIDICNEMGIPTIQQEHHALQFSRINFDPARPTLRPAFAQCYWVFDRGELDFHKLVFIYDNILNPGKPVQMRMTGNTELSYDIAVEAAKTYPVRRRLTYMISSLEDNDLGTEEQIQAIDRWRMDVYEQLRLLKERTGVEITIRYTPYCDMEQRRAETPILESWGLQVSSSLPENLMEDMCTSGIIMSTTSTVLSTAISMGKTVYRVEDPGVTYLKVNPDVIDITVDEISQIDIPDVMADKPIAREKFFDIDRVIKYEKS